MAHSLVLDAYLNHFPNHWQYCLSKMVCKKQGNLWNLDFFCLPLLEETDLFFQKEIAFAKELAEHNSDTTLVLYQAAPE